MYVIDEKNLSRIYDEYINENGEVVQEIYYDRDYWKYKKNESLLDQNYDDYEEFKKMNS